MFCFDKVFQLQNYITVNSVFIKKYDTDTSANNFNHDIENIGWAFQWKMKFNPDPTKHAQEIIFSRKKTVSIHPIVYLNNIPVNSAATHKHFGIILDSKLNHENHLQSVFSRVHKTIVLLRKIQPTLPRKSLVTIGKSFIRPHLDYSDVVYDRVSNESFH